MEKSRNMGRQKEAKPQPPSGGDCDSSSSCWDTSTYMLNWRHENVTAICSDMWILAAVPAPILGWLFRHLQPAGRGRVRPWPRSWALTFPAQSAPTAWLGHSHQPLDFFVFRILYLSVVAFSLVDFLYIYWLSSNNPTAIFILFFILYGVFLRNKQSDYCKLFLLFPRVKSFLVLNIFFPIVLSVFWKKHVLIQVHR